MSFSPLLPTEPPPRDARLGERAERAESPRGGRGAASLPAHGARNGERRPRARLRAEDDDAGSIADWASLHGDLARRPGNAQESGAPVVWRVHDRTHVEFAIDYALGREPRAYTWEAYFFVPESFRLDAHTYDKRAIYDDLWSYVRYAVPALPFADLASLEPGSALARVRDALHAAAGRGASSEQAALATRRLRLYACLLRASGLSAMRDAEHALAHDPGAAASFAGTSGAVAAAFRGVLAEADALPLAEEVHIAARWTDEDISLVLETLCATLGVAFETRAPGHLDLAAQLAARAVKESRHRRDKGYDSVGSAASTQRRTEHFEFRRHVLKRFTASVLWLSLEVRDAATWMLHALYAVAAAAAMAFALVASLTAPNASTNVLRYGLPLVVAYAIKDRLKALLQSVFAGWIARHFPDRTWFIHDRERGRRIGTVRERAAFLPFRSVPDEVLDRRRMTRAHALEEQARPERVLWHQKTVTTTPVLDAVAGTAEGEPSLDFSTLTEIFRLNLHRWLRHTDDPNRTVVFADPEDAHVYQVTARRVYNINVVYRLRAGDARAAEDGPWHRIRVVVSRKGIERIDAIC